MLKLVSRATAAALFAMASVSLAQAPAAKDSPSATPSTPSSGASAVPSKCLGMTGPEREKCIKEEGGKEGAAGGATATPSTPSSAGAASPGAGSSTPSTPAEPKKKE